MAELLQVVSDDHDFTDGTIFNSICTQPHPLALQVAGRFLHTNRGDNRLFPSLARVDAELTRMLGELVDLPDAAGFATSGGTEANLLATHAAIHHWRQTHRSSALMPLRPRLITGPGAHFSFDKVARLLDVDLVRVGGDEQFRAAPDAIAQEIDERCALVVATAGSSETGAVDDVPAIADLCAHRSVPLHVDAASGALLVPAMRAQGAALPDIGFTNAGVTSMTVDLHKFGAAPIPSGHLLARERRWCAGLETDSHYVGTSTHRTLLGTAPGAGMLAAWALLKHQGHDGLSRDVHRLLALREALTSALADRGIRLAYRPDLMMLGIAAPTQALATVQRRGFIASYSHRLGQLRLVVQLHQRPENYPPLADAILPVITR